MRCYNVLDRQTGEILGSVHTWENASALVLATRDYGHLVPSYSHIKVRVNSLLARS